jgi:hypothetical protein
MQRLYLGQIEHRTKSILERRRLWILGAVKNGQLLYREARARRFLVLLKSAGFQILESPIVRRVKL